MSKKLIARCLTALMVLAGLQPMNIPETKAATAASPVGMNLSEATYYMTGIQFNDVMKTAGLYNADDGAEWWLVFANRKGHYPKGKYVLTYQGKGGVEPVMLDGGEIVKNEPGRIEFNIANPGPNGLDIVVSKKDPSDPVRDLHLYIPGGEGQGMFNREYLQVLTPFSPLRFMDWGRTNNSPLKRWSERPLVTDQTWTTDKGVPLEVMIDLCNTLNKDGWFCVPHQADNEYVTNMAKLIKQRLKPGLKAYIEYSNECWNGMFEQSDYCTEHGNALGLGNPGPVEANARFYSQRTVEVTNICKGIIGSNCVRVLSGFGANEWWADLQLSWNNAAANVDVYSPALYFGYEYGSQPEKVLAMSDSQLIADVKKNITSGQAFQDVKGAARICQKYNLDYMAYEGGSHLTGVGMNIDNEALTAKFTNVNRSAAMYELYDTHMANFYASGGKTFCHFNDVCSYSKWGSWGALEYQDQGFNFPRYQALLKYALKAPSPAPAPTPTPTPTPKKPEPKKPEPKKPEPKKPEPKKPQHHCNGKLRR